MTHPDDIVPSNLDEAVKVLKELLSEEDLAEIRWPTSVSTQCHFDCGMSMRNAWSLWETKSCLVQWFKKTYDVDHADDISGIILECLWNDVRGEPRRDKILAQRFIKHWKKTAEPTNI